MPTEFKLPDLGEGIHEAEIIEILVSVGESVEDGQTVMIIETDKATTEIPAPVTGKVLEIRVEPGRIVNVGDVLMVFAAEDEKVKEGEKKIQIAPDRGKEGKEAEPKAPEKGKAPPVERGPLPATPSTRRLARELGVELSEVKATGPGGRVTREDVRAFAENRQRVKEARTIRPADKAPEIHPYVEDRPLPDFDQWGNIERIPLRSIRRATAKRMAQSWSQIPHVTHTDEADITELEAFRRRHKDEIQAQGGSLSLTVFVLKAAVAALKVHPRFNASLDRDREEIILKRYYHIGVAVDTEKGLVVPIIRDVDRKNLTQLSIELHSLIGRMRAGRIEREDVAGGTFTITNVGSLGGTGFTPIINYPQVAILGVAQARYQAVVRKESDEDFQIVPRLMLPLALGFDHRVVDGADAARFLNVVIETLEDPEKLLMAI